jgi:hypothetical protein
MRLSGDNVAREWWVHSVATVSALRKLLTVRYEIGFAGVIWEGDHVRRVVIMKINI